MITVNHPKAGPVPFPDGTSRDAIMAKMKSLNVPSEPVVTQGRMNPMTDMPSRMGMPAGGAIADIGMETGGGLIGQAVGAGGGPAAPVTIPLGGFIGGFSGNVVGQLRQQFNGEKQDFSLGEAIAAGVLSSIPGSPLVAATTKTLSKVAAKNVVANVAAKSIQEGIDNDRMITPTEAVVSTATGFMGAYAGKALDTGKSVIAATRRKIADEVENQTLKIVTDAGYMINPSVLKSGKIVSALEYLGGKQLTDNEFALLNADVTVDLAKKAIGISPSKALNQVNIDGIKDVANEAYAAVEAVSPRAKAALLAYRKAQDNANASFRAADSNLSSRPVQLKEEAQAYLEEAERYWKTLVAEANKKTIKNGVAVSNAALIPKLEEAKKLLSKVHVVETAFNADSGKMSAGTLARATEARGTVTTDELEIIRKMANTFPSSVKDTESMHQGGLLFNRLTTMAALSIAGKHYAGNVGMVLPAIAGISAIAVPPVSRAILTNPTMNRLLSQRSYEALMPQDVGSMFVQKGINLSGLNSLPQSQAR
jgi:hypothetical protein